MAKCGVCGLEMLEANGCSVDKIHCNGKTYERIRYGTEDGRGNPGEICHDCGCHYGEYHHFGCDVERCPDCGGQLISCDCKDVYVLSPGRCF